MKQKIKSFGNEETATHRVLKSGQMWTFYLETRPEQVKTKKNKLEMLTNGILDKSREFNKAFGYWPDVVFVSNKSFSPEDFGEDVVIVNGHGKPVRVEVEKHPLNLVYFTTEENINIFEKEKIKEKEKNKHE